MSYISFNLSSNQIYSKALVDKIEVLTESFNITSGKILIEITESTFIADLIKAKLALNGLKKIGFNIALNDFGTGQSSLAHLKDFPVDKIKIDKSFVSVIQEDEDVAHIVESVILLAKKPQLDVIVEGVKTEFELNKINLLEGRYIQGYYYGKPEPIPLAHLQA
jgi:EAL domain-containing protein (putative c-di-GMP-specific phosphodiesterase class I)